MRKIRLVLVGSGWRSLYYVRIARALPEQFEVAAVLCRSAEKAQAYAEANKVHTTTSAAECRALKPDLIVVAVNKSSIAAVSEEWLNAGFAVLCETPAALTEEDLCRLWQLSQQGAKLAVAEQYTRYPICQAMLRVLDTELIGSSYTATVSKAHDYHGANLIRAFLKTDMQPFTVSGRAYTHPTVETMSRQERFTDGRIADKTRTVATFEFANGKVGFYDFNAEQYRSPIRSSYIAAQGCRGEMQDSLFRWLDQNNMPCSGYMNIRWRTFYTDSLNPNLRKVREISEITFEGRTVYTPPFGLAGLSEDETAIAQVIADTAAWAWGEKEPEHPLAEALQDAYMSILLHRAVETGKPQSSTRMPWHG